MKNINFRLIPISGKAGTGKFAKVSPEDFDQISKYSWCLSSNGYAKRGTLENGKHKTVFMHREVVGAPDGQIVDHKDSDKLNNVRSNLRLGTQAQNLMNRAKSKSSGHKGVRDFGKTSPYPLAKPWAARVKVKGKEIHIGYFATEEEAARAYDRVAFENYGEFAKLNFPDRS